MSILTTNELLLEEGKQELVGGLQDNSERPKKRCIEFFPFAENKYIA